MPRKAIDGRKGRKLLADYPEMLTVADLATYLGLCTVIVARELRAGRLPGTATGTGERGTFLIPRRAVEEWERRLGERAAAACLPGIPPVCQPAAPGEDCLWPHTVKTKDLEPAPGNGKLTPA